MTHLAPVVGADDTGMTCKDLVVADLLADPRAAVLADLGVHVGEHRQRTLAQALM